MILMMRSPCYFCSRDFLFLAMNISNAIQTKKVLKVGKAASYQIVEDQLTIEEPLEIQLAFWEANELKKQSISITMRTPGEDEKLALGFLYTEGIINATNEISKIAHLPSWDSSFSENRIVVGLKKGITVDLKRLQRHFYTSSSCGVCGKASIDALQTLKSPELPNDAPIFSTKIIHQLPSIVRQHQTIFQSTGGIHAAALFDNNGTIQILQEDVGRHNALDKLIGQAFQQDLLPLHQHLLMVSGRASFELVQKALMAEIPILAAVGAPSSLAVELAEAHGMTLLGFVRNEQFNIYSGSQRIS